MVPRAPHDPCLQVPGRRARVADPPAPSPPAASPPEPVTLHNADLVMGPNDDQVYPARLLTRSLDGASVNLGHKTGRAAGWQKCHTAPGLQ